MKHTTGVTFGLNEVCLKYNVCRDIKIKFFAGVTQLFLGKFFSIFLFSKAAMKF